MPEYEDIFLKQFRNLAQKADHESRGPINILGTKFAFGSSSLKDIHRLLTDRQSTTNAVGQAVDALPFEKKLKYRDAIRYLEATYPGLLAWRAQHPLQNPLAHPGKVNVYLVGHGNWQGDFGHFAVPPTKAVRFYTRDKKMVDDSFERVLLAGGTFEGISDETKRDFSVETVTAGKSSKNYHVHYPGNLHLTKSRAEAHPVPDIAINACANGDYFYAPQNRTLHLGEFMDHLPQNVLLHCLFCREQVSDADVDTRVGNNPPIWGYQGRPAQLVHQHAPAIGARAGALAQLLMHR